MAGNDDTYQREFYAPWPDLGKKLSQQWNEIRNNMSALAPVVRGVGLDSNGDYSNLNGLEKMSMQAIEVGKQDFHNKFRFHYNKTDDTLEIAYNDGTTVVPHWYTTWIIDSDGFVTQQNTPTTASNVGGGAGLFKQKTGVDLEFRSLTASGVMAVTQGTNTVAISSTAEANTYSSDEAAAPSGDAGVGVEIILSDSGKTGVDLPFKALRAGPNVVLTNTGTAIKIESTAQVVEFYGIAVGHSDDSVVYPEVHNFKVNVDQFYLTQQKTHPSAKTSILNVRGDIFHSNTYVKLAGDTMTGALYQADGLEATPSFSFSSDHHMGMYYRAADDLGFVVNSTDVLRLLASAVLSEKQVQVISANSAAAPDYAFFPNTDGGMYDTGSAVGFSYGTTAIAALDASKATFLKQIQTIDGTKTAPALAFTTDTDTGVYSSGVGALDVSVADTNVHRFTSSAEYVIGTTPSLRLGLSGITNYWNMSASALTAMSIAPSGSASVSNFLTLDSGLKVFPSFPTTVTTTGFSLIEILPSSLTVSNTGSTVAIRGLDLWNGVAITNNNQTGFRLQGVRYAPSVTQGASGGTTTTQSIYGVQISPTMRTITASKPPLTHRSFVSQYSVNTSNAASGTQGDATNWNVGFWSSPTFAMVNSTGSMTISRTDGFLSECTLTTSGASQTTTVTQFNDIYFTASSLSGAGTETLTTRNYLNMEDDTSATNINAIKSVLTSGANKKFINHTGTAASQHTGVWTQGANIVMADNSITGIDTLTFTDVNGTIAGIQNQNLVDKSDTETISGAWDFSVSSPTVVDEAYGATWDTSTEVPTKNALYDKIETLVSAVDQSPAFYGVIFKETESGGAVMRDNQLNLDSNHFYLSGSTDGKPLLSLRNDQTFTGTVNVQSNLIAGIPGVEGSGINVGGSTYTSVFKASDIGGVNQASIHMHRHSDSLPTAIIASRARGETTAHSALQGGDQAMAIISTGWGTSTYEVGGRINFVVDSDATPADDNMPMHIDFRTQAPGSGSVNATLAMTIHSDQHVSMTNDLNLGRSLFADDYVNTSGVIAGTGFFYAGATIGTGTDTDSIIEFYDAASLAYTMGWDNSDGAFKIAGGAFDNTDDRIVLTAGLNTLKNTTDMARMRAGFGLFYITLGIAAGKASAPSLYFKDDPNTGIYSTGADVLAISTGGSIAGSFNSLGNLSLTGKYYGAAGTASAATYSWGGDANTGMYQSAAGVIGLSADATNTFLLSATAATAGVPILGVDGAVGGPSFAFASDSDSGIYQATPGDGDLDFASGGSLVATLDGSGLSVAGDTHVGGTLDAQTGFFYSALHVGGKYPGNDGSDMWKAYVTNASQDLTWAPSAQSKSGRDFIVDSSINLWPSRDGGTSQTFAINYTSSMATAVSGAASARNFINSSPTITYTASIPTHYTLYEHGTYTTTSGNALNTFRLFSGEPRLYTTGSSIAPLSPHIFQAAPTIQATNVTGGDLPNSGTVIPTMFDSQPILGSTGASGNLTFPKFRTLSSGGIITSASGGSATITEWIDLECLALTSSGTGTNTFTERIGLQLNNDSKAVSQTGIESTITHGDNRYFINHTGGADSHHTGDFYIHSGLYVDQVHANFGDFYTRLKLNQREMKFGSDGILYAWDPVRQKYLSVTRTNFQYGVNSSTDTSTVLVLSPSGTGLDGSQYIGNVMPRNATITAVMVGARNVNTAALDIDLYTFTYNQAGSTNTGTTYTIPADGDRVFQAYPNENIDVDANTGLAFRTDPVGGSLYTIPYAHIEVAWRLD